MGGTTEGGPGLTTVGGSSVTGRRNSPVLSAPTIGGSCGRGSTTPTIPGTSTGTSWTTAQAGATLTDTFSGSGTSSQRTRGCTDVTLREETRGISKRSNSNQSFHLTQTPME